MTREQAINYLKSSGMSDEQIKSVINALTCEDCISRKDVMAIIEWAYDECKIDGYTDYCEIRDMVKGLQAVTPQTSKD